MAAAAALAFAADPPELPWIDRIEPLSVQRGTTARVEVHGSKLDRIIDGDLHTESIQWLKTIETSAQRVVGEVRISADAPLGPHVIRLRGANGPTNSRLFNVTQWPSIAEMEPNDRPQQAQQIRLTPQSIQGSMKELIDVDLFAFEAREGERWMFDLRSLDYGTHLESELALLDLRGKRVAGNDDRDEYDESPLLEHTFTRSGRYYLEIDQYRGPQGVSCSQNCGYSLEVSQMPRIEAVSPLGARRGETVRLELYGSAMETITSVWLVPARTAEHFRMTYPFTMPVRLAADPLRPQDIQRVDARLVGPAERTRVAVEAAIPAGCATGLWRVWSKGRHGESPGMNIEVSDATGYPESRASLADWRSGEYVIDGRLSRESEEDRYPVIARAGKPIHLWTIAAQLGLPAIDTVLELREVSGKIVASHDDVMSGQGTPVGNPDSSIVHVPEKDGTLTAIVRDRIGRGGPTYGYRLHVKSEHAGFQLLTSPENFTIRRGTEEKLTVFLIREPGFEGEVQVWFEGLPPGITAGKGSFRADQAFGPSADGDNMIIPESMLPVRAAADAAPGEYELRLMGRGGPDGRVVLAHTSLWIGPPRNRNDNRRPRPAVTVSVTE
jgi:hypothetical protein